MIHLWLHGRSFHTQRAYRADVERFRAHVPKPLNQVTPSDLQAFADSLTGLEEFLQTDLGICQTFADVVRTEMQMGDGAAAKRVFAKAEQAYAMLRTYRPG